LVGNQISLVAISLLAATNLAATSVQLGALAAAQTVGFLLIGLPAGVLADRLPRRQTMMVCNLARAGLLLSIPIGAWLGNLTIHQLIVVAVLIGLAQVIFDVCYQSYLPGLVSREHLLVANGRLESSRSAAVAGGPALGGVLSQLLGSARAVALDAVGYVVSAVLLWRIRDTEPVPSPAGRRPVYREVLEGMRFVAGNPVLRTTTGAAAIYNLCYGMMQPLVILLLVTHLRLPGTIVGVLLAAAGVGGLLGAFVAGRVARRVGSIRTILVAELGSAPCLLLLPLAGPGWGLTYFAAGYLALHLLLSIFNVANVSLRQASCPDHLLGRMNATVRFAAWGALPIGAVAGGFLGELVGPRFALTIAGLGLLVAAGWLFASPLRGMRDLPTGSGPAFDIIDTALGELGEYAEFRAGRMDRATYCSWISAHIDELRRTGLNEDQICLSTRFPVDERGYVAEILEDLHGAGVIPSVAYPETEFDIFRGAVSARLAHGGMTTYIFPEEARLMFALAHIVAPARTVFLGSYYGYWAVWAMPGIIAAGGHATLVDVDARVIEVARRNFARLGMSAAADFVVADATVGNPDLPADVDLYVLDAEGPKGGVPPDLRDKAIYYPIMKANTPALRPDGLLVAHNMLLHNLTGNTYFTAKIANNTSQYARFHAHLDAHYDRHRAYPTSEGVGIYRKCPANVLREPSCVE
jgi:predicted O-methyltransferase YrrM/predicted MFS family arabinose efflux permease